MEERKKKVMKNMKFVRTWAMFALAFTVMLSVTGGTIAWFTDSVSSTGNVIAAGNLAVELYAADSNLAVDSDAWKNVEDSDAKPLFSYNRWEPGYTALKYIMVKNAGDLAFEYQIKLRPDVEIDMTETNLAEVIDVYYTVVDDNFKAPTKFNDLNGWTKINLKDMLNMEESTVHGVMLGNQEPMVIAIAMHMQESANNDYQGRTLGNNISIELRATQYTKEIDGFLNPNYDENATYPGVPVPIVNFIPKADLPTDATIVKLPSFEFTDEKVALDVGYTFIAPDTVEEAEQNPYADWHADYVVTVNDDLTANSCGIAGAYGDYGWWAFKLPEDTAKGTSFRLLKEAAGIQFNYVELCELVKVFNCGAFNYDNANVGKSITVELRLYEPDPDTVANNNTNNEGETGEYITIASYDYTFIAH